MEKQRIRELALQVLQKNPQTHVHMIENEIRQLTDDYHRHDTLGLQEVVWDLLVQGVLAPGKNSLNLNLPFVHVTEYGTRCLDDGAIRAHDPEGYAAHLAASCGKDAGSPFIQTARESQLAFLAGRFVASVVMLARAAEMLIGQASRTLDITENDPRTQLAGVVDALESRQLPAALQEAQASYLAGLRTLLDLSRSADGQPLVAAVDRDQVLAYLLLFPTQCRFVYDLVSHLEGDSPD